MENGYRECQSCGLPFKQDTAHAGTNDDLTFSEDYCGDCYQGGSFTNPGITAEQMQLVARKRLRKLDFFRKVVTGASFKDVTELGRWRKPIIQLQQSC